METDAVRTAALDFSSDFRNIEVAERILVDLLDGSACGPEDLDRVLSALREGLANAIRHGNRLEEERRVRLEVEVTRSALRLRIEDEGEGFDPGAVPDPTAPENLLRPSGRGIFFMRQLMDRVEFSSAPGGGTLVTLECRLGTHDGSTHEE